MASIDRIGRYYKLKQGIAQKIIKSSYYTHLQGWLPVSKIYKATGYWKGQLQTP